MRFFNIIAFAVSAAISAKAVRIESCTEPNTIALTFDDGPYEFTNELMDTLKANKIHATFFVNAFNYWKDFPENKEKQKIWIRAKNEGHQIASHTWDHSIPDNQDELVEKLKKLDDLIEANTGYRPKYIRAPLGECNPECVDRFEKLGYKVIQWDTDTHDWDVEKDSDDNVLPESKDKRVAAAQEFLTAEFAKKNPNYLILMHDVYNHTVTEIVPWIIKNNPLKDYKYVTVAECLGDYSISLNETVTNSTDRSIVSGNSTDTQNLNKSGAISNSNMFSIMVTFLFGFLYLFF